MKRIKPERRVSRRGILELPDPFYVFGDEVCMGFVGRLLSFLLPPVPSASGRRAPIWSDTYGHLGAVGESHYQPALRRAARNGRVCWATLIPEPDNPFDGNAVAVQIQGETVGYLQRTDARRYQRRLRALIEPMEVPAKLIGGTWSKPSFGVLLDCRDVERLPTPRPARRKKVVVDPNEQPF